MSPDRKFWLMSFAAIAALLIFSGSMLGFNQWKVTQSAQQKLNQQSMIVVRDAEITLQEISVPRISSSSETFLLSETKVGEFYQGELVLHDMVTGSTKNILQNDTITEISRVSDSEVGYISLEDVDADYPIYQLTILNIHTGETTPVTNTDGQPYDVYSWTSVDDNHIIIQQNQSNLMLVYSVTDGSSELVGQFDTIGGTAGSGQVWFYNADSDRTISLHSTETGGTQILTFPATQDHIVTQVTVLPSDDVLWRYTGLEQNPEDNTQGIILQAANGYYRSVYEGMQKEFVFTSPVTFNVDSSLLAVATGPESRTTIIDSVSGTVLSELEAEQVWFVK